MNVTFILEWQSIVNLIASEDYNKIFKKLLLFNAVYTD